jgi:hypothetical protein
MTTVTEDQERFEEIIEEIGNLADEALNLLPEGVYENAKSYWYAAIKSALTEDNEFPGQSTHNMTDTLSEYKDFYNRERNSDNSYQFNSQDQWDAYIAQHGINIYQEYEDDDK